MKKFRILSVVIFISSFFVYSDHFSKSLWLHSTDFSNNKKIATVEINEKFEFYKDIGVQNLYVFKTLKNESKKEWNFLKFVIKIAHQKGMQVHPVITSGNKVRNQKFLKKKQSWLIKDPFGKTLPYLNLSNPDVRKYIQKQAKKMLKYDVDGIHLDYIRFPYLSSKTPGDSVSSVMVGVVRTAFNHFIPDNIFHTASDNYFSYDKETLELFNRYFNEEDEGGSGDEEYILAQWRKWNASNVTLLVKGIKDQIKKSGKDIPLSAAIFSNREFALNSLGQDWGKWAAEETVDVVCPMLYSNDNSWFKDRLKTVMENVAGGCKVVAGIAIVSSTNKNTPEGMVSQIRIAKELGADGVVFFSGGSLTEEFGKTIKETGNLREI